MKLEAKIILLQEIGAIIYDMKKDKIIYEDFIPKEKVLEIVKICEKNSINYSVYTQKTILATSLKYNVLYYHKENLKKNENQKTNINIINNMYEFIKNSKDDKFLKITICDENKLVFNSIMQKIRKVNNISALEVSHMSRKTITQGTKEIIIEYYYTEITKNNVDKWKAIEFLIEKLKIKPEEVIAIGDNLNDKKMIEKAGVGIAMKDSIKEIINIANEVAPANYEEGVSKILQKYYKNINF